MIQITVNGVPVQLSEPVTVAGYLEERGYKLNRIAVELNGAILPKADYGSAMLAEHDTMEVVSFVGGG